MILSRQRVLPNLNLGQDRFVRSSTSIANASAGFNSLKRSVRSSTSIAHQFTVRGPVRSAESTRNKLSFSQHARLAKHTPCNSLCEPLAMRRAPRALRLLLRLAYRGSQSLACYRPAQHTQRKKRAQMPSAG